MNKRRNKKYIVLSLLIIELLMLTLTFKAYDNKTLQNINEEYVVDNNKFGMYVEMLDANGNSTYEEYIDSNSFPEGYIINYEKSKCVDTNGNELSGILNGTATELNISTNKTSFCYIYFDVAVNINESQNFEYTGDIQEFKVPVTGIYHLEVWGAQGGNASSNSGGKGGYSDGYISLTKGQILYIVVGGQGSSAAGSNIATGGYNGGGNTAAATAGWATYTIGSGGGATHIATADGLLAELVSNQNSVLIVAGGGGGANNDSGTSAYCANGGNGGGKEAPNVSTAEGSATGGTQLAAGTGGGFGYGGTGGSAGGGRAGGGGGWYGGGYNTNYGAAAGGSGYIRNAEVTNSYMNTGNHTGNGYARITYISDPSSIHTHTSECFHESHTDSCYESHVYTQCNSCGATGGTSSHPSGSTCTCGGTYHKKTQRVLKCGKSIGTISCEYYVDANS